MENQFHALGHKTTAPSKVLETFPCPKGVLEVSFTSEELTSHCPVTGQPDFNTVEIEYAPDGLCVESKSLKNYLWSFRDEALFGEQLAATIAQDLDTALKARWVRVILEQHIRGGLQMTVTAEVRVGRGAWIGSGTGELSGTVSISGRTVS